MDWWRCSVRFEEWVLDALCYPGLPALRSFFCGQFTAGCLPVVGMMWSRRWGGCVDVGWGVGVDGYFMCWEGVKSLLVRTNEAEFAWVKTFALVPFVSIASLVKFEKINFSIS